MPQRTDVAERRLGVVRPADLTEVYSNPRAVLRQRAKAGKVHRLAHGVYVTVPEDTFDPKRWRPRIETTAAAVGTAVFGDGHAVLMGMTAARMHRVVPRANARAEIAVPRRHRPMQLVDREHGVVQFVRRDLAQLEVQPMNTELGVVQVTTPEQTLVDLATTHREPDQDVLQAMHSLARKVNWKRVWAIAEQQRGGRTAQPLLRRLAEDACT